MQARHYCLALGTPVRFSYCCSRPMQFLHSFSSRRFLPLTISFCRNGRNLVPCLPRRRQGPVCCHSDVDFRLPLATQRRVAMKTKCKSLRPRRRHISLTSGCVPGRGILHTAFNRAKTYKFVVALNFDSINCCKTRSGALGSTKGQM